MPFLAGIFLRWHLLHRNDQLRGTLRPSQEERRQRHVRAYHGNAFVELFFKSTFISHLEAQRPPHALLQTLSDFEKNRQCPTTPIRLR